MELSETNNRCRKWVPWTVIALLAVLAAVEAGATSIARVWSEQILNAIRIDTPHPPAHARNLFHLSVAMYDSWAAFDEKAVGYVYRRKHLNDFQPADIPRAREMILSHAAYTLLKHRYRLSVNWTTTHAALDLQMLRLGLDASRTGTEGNTPSAIGNRIGRAVIDFAASDGSQENLYYRDFTYTAVNEPLVLSDPGQVMADPNRWQPLAFDTAFTQNGLIADNVQHFLGSQWGHVQPFAMFVQSRDGVYHDPGQPPLITDSPDDGYKSGNVEVLYYSSLLDPDQQQMIDISPGAIGNNSLGKNDGRGHPVNPYTGLPYSPNVVKHGDFGRVIAEYWADGPHSETPPGHWNVIANEVADHPDLEKRIGGTGPVVSDLEWDVKTYFALNAAVHDAAVAAWGCKRVYDYVRPISAIRYMAQKGQSSHPDLPGYHPHGLPLIDGLIELITEESSMPGERHDHLAGHIGKIAVMSWIGEPEDKLLTYSGVDWILAELWFPYQRDTFVTPAFAGYVSGHSTFSRAGAEVLARMTGSPFFPGGMATFTAERNNYLHFEMGPSQTVVLQWATYFDAADQAGLSRLYGGIHVPVDDGPGRIMGSECGIECWNLATKYFDGSILELSPEPWISRAESGALVLRFQTTPGHSYRVQGSTNLEQWSDIFPWFNASQQVFTFSIPPSTINSDGRHYFRIQVNTEPVP